MANWFRWGASKKPAANSMTLAEGEHVIHVVAEAILAGAPLAIEHGIRLDHIRPLSSLHGYDFFQIDTALKLRVANYYLIFAACDDANGESATTLNESLAQLVNSCGITGFTVASSFVPDAELEKVRQLPADSRECENAKLNILDSAGPFTHNGFKDARLASLETMDSFAKYCQHIGPSNPIYWQHVYTRLGLAYTKDAPNGNEPDWELFEANM